MSEQPTTGGFPEAARFCEQLNRWAEAGSRTEALYTERFPLSVLNLLSFMSDASENLNPVQPRPWWAWLLVLVCMLIAVVATTSTLWVLGAIGIGAALTVMNISRSTERTEKARLVACLMITAMAWIGFGVLSILLERM